MTESDCNTKWTTTVIVSSSLKNHEVVAALQNQNHRVRYSDSVEPGSIIFSHSGVAFLLLCMQELVLLQKDSLLEKFIGIHRNSFLLLIAALHGKEEWSVMLRMQQRFLGSNLRVIPVHTTADIMKLMLTIAKATSKPHIDNICDRLMMAKKQIIEHSSVWKMLHNIV
ncbi:protein SPO16 homolog [Ambystoma mexicanum]|uniref:protein SPO16 homolog n=1 Tax=Ambystoma mexicanum TaxID=8296 RepID=UPI0037E90C81